MFAASWWFTAFQEALVTAKLENNPTHDTVVFQLRNEHILRVHHSWTTLFDWLLLRKGGPAICLLLEKQMHIILKVQSRLLLHGQAAHLCNDALKLSQWRRKTAACWKMMTVHDT